MGGIAPRSSLEGMNFEHHAVLCREPARKVEAAQEGMVTLIYMAIRPAWPHGSSSCHRESARHLIGSNPLPDIDG